MSYATTNETRDFARQIAKDTGIDPALTAFALGDGLDCGADTGANRNGLLLANAGETFVSADDDTICNLTSPRLHREATLSFAEDPTLVRLSGELADGLAPSALGEECLFKAHEQLLGRRFFEVTSPTSCLTGNDEEDQPLLSELLARSKSLIRVTATGF
ncbi:MAG TPA: hypothetical protein VGF45_21610, partial [Polyangia bacterium]